MHVTKQKERTNKMKCHRNKASIKKECRLDCTCIHKFNKLLWEKWPEDVWSMYDRFREAGYIVRFKIGEMGYPTLVEKRIVDLLIAEDETRDEIFNPFPSSEDRSKQLERLAHYRVAQNAKLIYTVCVKTTDGAKIAFFLFRQKGTEQGLVYIVNG